MQAPLRKQSLRTFSCQCQCAGTSLQVPLSENASANMSAHAHPCRCCSAGMYIQALLCAHPYTSVRAHTHTHTHTSVWAPECGCFVQVLPWRAFPHYPDVFPHHGICTWIQSRCQVQIRTRHRVILFRGLRKKSPPSKNNIQYQRPPFPPGPMLAATRVFLALRKKSPFMLPI